jgi:hypothetical protein
VAPLSEAWALLTDGTFETLAEGEKLGQASAQASYADYNGNPVSAIEGKQSLLITDPDGGGVHLRLKRSANQTHLSFVAYGNLFAEAAAIGSASHPFKQGTTGDHYDVELEPGNADVLLSIYDQTNEVETGHHEGVWVDAIRFE